MSRLRIFSDDDPVTPDYHSTDHASIAAMLEKIGVRFEQWEACKPVQPGATPEEVMAAYKEDIDRLVKDNGFKTVDVVSIEPDNENREAMRAKFLDEHFHKEDEVRFFVAGSGLFTLHVDERVYEIKCESGDLIGVPDGTRHWFDMGRNRPSSRSASSPSPTAGSGTSPAPTSRQKFPRFEPKTVE
jgi:1,2-dihydroxy-3-keto-5-methylthiopentene dioxygenase